MESLSSNVGVLVNCIHLKARTTNFSNLKKKIQINLKDLNKIFTGTLMLHKIPM